MSHLVIVKHSIQLARPLSLANHVQTSTVSNLLYHILFVRFKSIRFVRLPSEKSLHIFIILAANIVYFHPNVYDLA